MDLAKNGILIHNLRKEKGMTQKQIADKLGVVPKTVSKWETGHGFPDVSVLSELADILGVSEKALLSGKLNKNEAENGNIRKIKFYICPQCGGIVQGTADCQITCCGKILKKQPFMHPDKEHEIKISEIENDLYVEIRHKMEKDHYISFFSYVTFDRVLTVRLYPQQDCTVRFSKMYGGKIYFFCTKHGLFEY